MGFVRRIADWLDPPREKRSDASIDALRGCAGDFTALHLSGGSLFDGDKDYRPAITPAVAETNATVLAAVNAITGAIASFPVHIYRLTDEGREVDKNHAVTRLVRNGVNGQNSWPDFIRWLVAEMLLYGNGLAEIVTDGSGRTVSLKPHSWRNVTPVLLESGRLAFDVIDIAPVGGLAGPSAGKRRRILDSEVLQLKDRTNDGYLGVSRLARCSPPVRAALTQQVFNEFLYANRATPSGILSFPEKLTPEQRQQSQEGLQDNWSGVRQTGKVLLVDGGANFHSVSTSPEHLEMNAAMRFATEEIARIFGVPLPLLNIWDHSSFTNSETAGRWFANFTLAPIIRSIEEAFRRSAFSPATRDSHEMEFDMSGLLRGDAEARWKAHEIAVKNGILTPNEIRTVEGWNPRSELDEAPTREGGENG